MSEVIWSKIAETESSRCVAYETKVMDNRAMGTNG